MVLTRALNVTGIKTVEELLKA